MNSMKDKREKHLKNSKDALKEERKLVKLIAKSYGTDIDDSQIDSFMRLMSSLVAQTIILRQNELDNLKKTPKGDE